MSTTKSTVVIVGFHHVGAGTFVYFISFRDKVSQSRLGTIGFGPSLGSNLLQLRSFLIQRFLAIPVLTCRGSGIRQTNSTNCLDALAVMVALTAYLAQKPMAPIRPRST